MTDPATTIREALVDPQKCMRQTTDALAALTELEQQVAVQRDATQNQYEMTCEAIRRGEALERERDQYADTLRKIADGNRPEGYGTWHKGTSWRAALARAALDRHTKP